MVPSSLKGLSSLEKLDLSHNELNGSILGSLGQLSDLVRLDVSNNSFNDVFSETHFSGLKKLKYLLMSSTLVSFNVSSSWVPPFKLLGIKMIKCNLGPKFPAWLRTQNELHYLSLSGANISDTIPDFLWKLSPNMYHISLSNNSFSCSITRSIGEKTSNLVSLSLSSNRLNGSIPLSLCKMKYLANLYLQDNHLTSEIPQCLGDLQFLEAMDLRNNSLSGVIPTSIGHLSRLQSLHLYKNKLSGELPPTMKSCEGLVTLDLGENGFSGNIPNWIGEELSSLKFLFLQSNKFDGNLPPQLSLLSDLQVLDLAQNNISGTIPTCFGNFTAMAINNKTNKIIYSGGITDALESIVVYSKGSQLKYSTTISLVVHINLSGNNLCGEIPQEITHLFGLLGKIPENINGLRQMESLDLSCNRLSGAIPDSLSQLTFLDLLNLSYNNFSGRIPRGNQLDTIIDASISWGNPFLCGPPLLNQCPENETSHDSQSVVDQEESNDELLMHLLYISMVFGFIVGFWVVCGILIFIRSWRIAYYQFFDDMRDLLYVKVARYVAILQKTKIELVGNEGQ
ncbi:putative LRR receptor-like serine/threonine-protein kinase [Cinnamomum micranthum f. kanehirae]|uniref:Putative LRR receptor-like serine/threonine-protein kinase n=1 Tax=Cinnamomum micranthum f. kanehirae TaxID=337451 RepID=A0A3S3N483_9MAGN|nr:putative LRR receptor-like serine/threonine-protein kinase [Cinnamomum micranthum f. kanehirae]